MGSTLPNRLYQLLYLRGYRLAQGIGDDDIGGAFGTRIRGDAQYPRGIDDTLERTGERGRDTQLDGAVAVTCEFDSGGHRGDTVLCTASYIGLVV